MTGIAHEVGKLSEGALLESAEQVCGVSMSVVSVSSINPRGPRRCDVPPVQPSPAESRE